MAEKENLPAKASVFGGAVQVRDLKALAGRAQAAAQNTPRGGAPGGSDYMQFSGKTGRYVIGVDKRDIGDEELWLVDVTSFEEGFVAWKGNRPAGKRMANIYSGMPVAQPQDDEGGPYNYDKGEGWFPTKALVLKSLDNEQQGYLALNSVSGVDAIAKFIGDFAARAANDEAAWPVVSLKVEKFDAQGFTNYKPVFDCVGWLTTEQCQELADGKAIDDLIDLPEPVEKPKPVVVTRRRRA